MSEFGTFYDESLREASGFRIDIYGPEGITTYPAKNAADKRILLQNILLILMMIRMNKDYTKNMSLIKNNMETLANISNFNKDTLKSRIDQVEVQLGKIAG